MGVSAKTSGLGGERKLNLLIGNFFIRVIPAFSVLALLFGFIFLYIDPLIERSHIEQRLELSKRLTDIAMSDLSNWYAGVEKGEISESYAKKAALEHMRGFRFGPDLNNYFWVLNDRDEIIMHPYRRDLENRSSSDVRGPDGELLRILFSKMSEASKSPEGGVIEYKWYYNDKKDVLENKVSYVRKFGPWGWTVGTGYYPSDIQMELLDVRKKIIITGIFIAFIISLIALFLSLKNVKTTAAELKARLDMEASEKKFRLFFENSPFSISVNRFSDGRFMEVNPAFVRLSRFSESEVIGKTLQELGIIDETDKLRELKDFLKSERAIVNKFVKVKVRNNAEKQLLYSSVVTEIRGVECVLAQSVDITENFRLEKNIIELEDRIAGRIADLAKLDSLLVKKEYEIDNIKSQLDLSTRAFQNAIEGFIITDVDANVVTVNRAFMDITGYSQDELAGKNPRLLKSERHDSSFYVKMWRELIETGSWSGEIYNRRKNGEIYPSYLNITAVRDSEGRIINYVGVTSDLTELQSSRDMLQHQIMHDSLTSLPNRFLLLDRISMACSRAAEQGSNLAVILVGLDRFDGINKAMGYLAGDDILVKTAERLRNVTEESITLARFEGDEFAVLLPYRNKMEELVPFLNRILVEIRAPFVLENETLMLTASIGIAVFPQDGESADILVKNASQAIDRAKMEERNSYRFFTDDLDEIFRNRLRMENDLKNAVLNREFLLYYQPKVKASTGTVKGMEALIRWERPGSGIVSPAEFVPFAEEIGVISGLGNYSLEEACLFSSELVSAGYNIVVGVNISPKQFMESNFAENILETIERTAIPPSCIELEITEGVVMHDIKRSVEIMNYLRAKGLRFSLDDFGTGYSSLSHIMNLPLSAIKIDKSFIDKISESPDTRAVVSALVYMARKLNLELVVEGVESLQQLEILKSIDQDIIIQGYFFSKPLSRDDFFAYLKKNY